MQKRIEWRKFLEELPSAQHEHTWFLSLKRPQQAGLVVRINLAIPQILRNLRVSVFRFRSASLLLRLDLPLQEEL